MPRFPAPEARVLPEAIVPMRQVCLLTAALLLAAECAGAQVITVLTQDRKPSPQRGAIVVEETLDTVRYTRDGSDKVASYDTKIVVSIDYGPGSDAYERGLKALASDDLVNAESLFGAASKDSTPGWVAAHALLRQAEAAARRGADGRKVARAAIAEFLTRFKEHRLLPEALLAKAAYAGLDGASAEADEAIASVVKLAQDGRVTADWAVRAQVAAGDGKLAAGDARGAASAYTAAASAASAARGALADRSDLLQRVEDFALQARVGSASCLLADGDVAGARSFYTQLAADGQQNPAVQAAAANGLAECDFREPGKLKQAQHAFATVAVTAAGIPTERARALYFLGQCAEQLGAENREPSARPKASAYYEEVLARYPETRWARLAQASLP
jgi:outer membrane protein assembly factor BamD (BamD/ComL family)